MYFDNGEGNVYRPPSEADSFILRVTIGCSHNECTFCSMYKDVNFRIRPMDEIIAQINRAKEYKEHIRKVFLADGDALVLSTDKLIKIISILNDTFPNLSYISCYASTQNINKKTTDDLIQLNKLGLKMIYLGVESGDDRILADVNKKTTSLEILNASKKVLNANIKLTTMVIIGLGGKTRSRENAINTGKLISDINPSALGVLTLVVPPKTPMANDVAWGKFKPLSPMETLSELKELVENLNLDNPCIFSSTHISNQLPLTGLLPRDKHKILGEINNILY
ncbi:radical SAM protein [Dethiothermospora halolimnae]|uniref:radical SAM protein n=1 Tax=Dethiothermospora halolimnae TaxID=3114390 RepID=UPI003CCC030E